MAWRDRLSDGLARTRQRLGEQLNLLLERGPDVSEAFWEQLEEGLIAADFGAQAATLVVERLRDQATRQALPDAAAVRALLAQTIADMFASGNLDPLVQNPSCALFVGINGSGKTTTVGKIAKAGVDVGRRVLLGGADTYRAAANQQLDIWAQRADVPIIQRERGTDPASVAYETLQAAERSGADLVLIDTAGRLHTSDELMRELTKVVGVTRKRAAAMGLPVFTLLVIDANTGQNGLAQAREFNERLDVDGVIITKLDGTAKGGIAVALSHQLNLPVIRVGIGEQIDDLQPFVALDFARALLSAPATAKASVPRLNNQEMPGDLHV
ncbi:MAG: signal recognition particle-docking protein FtsY [Coriobacteriales bacterium]|jgi:fused signal recognition particle receptor|nr:signal recognition particle-docking protein FtsY [Coriobacteriales bacterium]